MAQTKKQRDDILRYLDIVEMDQLAREGVYTAFQDLDSATATVDLGGYTGIPNTLPGAQEMIVKLMDDQAKATKYGDENLRILNEAVAMIEAARKALNAVEAPQTK